MRTGLFLAAAPLMAAVYDVGPGQPLAAIGEAPWATLQPGDVVRIHWRPEPYAEKWVICRQGTADRPIRVEGVAGPDHQLPVITGENALNAPGLNYWNEARAVLKIGGANTPPDTMPRHIIVENLEIRSARTPFTFTDRYGATGRYSANAAAIFVEKGEHITIRRSILHDSGNGLFVASSPTAASRHIVIEGNYIHSNGNPGSAFEHNSYTAAAGIVFQFNRYGPLREGANGNNLKDRSAGLVVRYNWIEGGNRQLDLVEADDSGLLQQDPRYRTTYVYGNILIEPDGAGNRQIVHYGGDNNRPELYRKGVLRFFNNTVVSTRTDRTTLFRLSTNDEKADVRNNIFYVSAPGNTLSLVDSTGVLELRGNWFKPGYRSTFGTLAGEIATPEPNHEGEAPGFADEAAQDYRLAPESPLIHASLALDPAVPLRHYPLDEYRRHQAGLHRLDEPFHVGALGGVANAEPVTPTGVRASDAAPR